MSIAVPSAHARSVSHSRSEAPRAHSELTPREREIADWIAQGKTNAEIAAILGPSRRTIEKHVEHILAKLGLENRLLVAFEIHRRAA